MRYISKKHGLLLQRNDGKTVSKFRNGYYIKGSVTTKVGAANVIDFSHHAADSTLDVNRVFDDDLNGAVTNCGEMCGLGSLNGIDETGSGALASVAAGYRGNFFEAPTLTGTTNAVSGNAGVYYIVLTGTVTYDGVEYSVGEQFVTDGSATATTGSGTFRLTLPPTMINECDSFIAEKAREMLLKDGLEVNDDWSFQNDGFIPNDSLVCTGDYYVGNIL